MAKSKLTKLEDDLIRAIAKTDNKELMDLFLKWQKERQKCNLWFIEEMIKLANEK